MLTSYFWKYDSNNAKRFNKQTDTENQNNLLITSVLTDKIFFKAHFIFFIFKFKKLEWKHL